MSMRPAGGSAAAMAGTDKFTLLTEAEAENGRMAGVAETK